MITDNQTRIQIKKAGKMNYNHVIKNTASYDFSIETLGSPSIESPVRGRRYISDNDRISFAVKVHEIEALMKSAKPIPSFQKAGPREKIYHDPAWTKAAIVTCGGLCPGLNDVIKALVNVLSMEYGVKDIYGIRYGYEGLSPQYHHQPVPLNPELVDAIHEDGGTILGSSRGKQDTAEMVDTLIRMNINILFCIGGDGTLRGANAIAGEIKNRC